MLTKLDASWLALFEILFWVPLAVFLFLRFNFLTTCASKAGSVFWKCSLTSVSLLTLSVNLWMWASCDDLAGPYWLGLRFDSFLNSCSVLLRLFFYKKISIDFWIYIKRSCFKIIFEYCIINNSFCKQSYVVSSIFNNNSYYDALSPIGLQFINY